MHTHTESQSDVNIAGKRADWREAVHEVLRDNKGRRLATQVRALVHKLLDTGYTDHLFSLATFAIESYREEEAKRVSEDVLTPSGKKRQFKKNETIAEKRERVALNRRRGEEKGKVQFAETVTRFMTHVMPNGKRLGDCTFGECAKIGGKFTKLSTMGKPREKVSSISEEKIAQILR